MTSADSVIPIGWEISRLTEAAQEADWTGNAAKADLYYRQAQELSEARDRGEDWYVKF